MRNKPGAYEQYLKELEIKNKLTLLDKAESYLLEAVNTSNEGYISEKGELERWVGGIDSEKYSKEIKKHSKRVRKNLEKELNESTKSKRIN